MKLILHTASPFARKVRVVALELGLMDRIELQTFKTRSEAAATLQAHNPLLKVPVLVTEDGTALYDSPVICEYLDSLHTSAKLVHADGPDRWRALRLQALGDGIGDAVVLIGSEGTLPEDQQRPESQEKQNTKINGGLDYLENNMTELNGALNIGQISVACALGYFDLRIEDNGWRENRPELAAWFAEFSNRPSMRETLYRRPNT